MEKNAGFGPNQVLDVFIKKKPDFGSVNQFPGGETTFERRKLFLYIVSFFRYEENIGLKKKKSVSCFLENLFLESVFRL